MIPWYLVSKLSQLFIYCVKYVHTSKLEVICLDLSYTFMFSLNYDNGVHWHVQSLMSSHLYLSTQHPKRRDRLIFWAGHNFTVTTSLTEALRGELALFDRKSAIACSAASSQESVMRPQRPDTVTGLPIDYSRSLKFNPTISRNAILPCARLLWCFFWPEKFKEDLVTRIPPHYVRISGTAHRRPRCESLINSPHSPRSDLMHSSVPGWHLIRSLSRFVGSLKLPQGLSLFLEYIISIPQKNVQNVLFTFLFLCRRAVKAASTFTVEWK